MITQYYETTETERLEFARLAAGYFAENPESVTFTKDGLKPDCFMALRWGLAGDCVVVVKIDSCEPIINYCAFVPRDKAKQHDLFNEGGLKAIGKGRP